MNWTGRLMRKNPKLAFLGSGGVTLGVLQAFPMVNFAEIFTSFISYLLSLLISALFGGDRTSVLFDQVFGGGGGI